MSETARKDNRVSDADWLDEAARYFEKRPTGGEDMAFWANVSNAERCRSIAQSLRSKPVGVEVKADEIEELIERLLDAQQDINLAANESMDQSLCDASALIDKTENMLRRILSAISLPEQELVAWRTWAVLSNRWIYTDHPTAEGLPLYASPQPKVVTEEDAPLMMRLVAAGNAMVGWADLSKPEAQVEWTKWRDLSAVALRASTTAISEPSNG